MSAKRATVLEPIDNAVVALTAFHVGAMLKQLRRCAISPLSRIKRRARRRVSNSAPQTMTIEK